MFTVHFLEISIAFVLKLYSLNIIKKNRESNRELANRNRIESGHLNRYPALLIMLQKISISNERCSFELSIHQRILKISSSPTVFSIDDINKYYFSTKSAYLNDF